MVNLTAAIERLTGRPHRLDGPYLICAEPGGDPYIATWDEAILGPRPTAEAIAAAGLEVARDAAVARIDAEAEVVRHLAITPGEGQMAAYQEKERQAAEFLADAAPNAEKYPDIYNEVGITAETAQGVAMAVQQAATSWRTFGRAVERVRLAAKRAVENAPTPEAVAEAEAAVVWPTV